MITFFVPGIPVSKGSAKAFVIKGTNRAVVTQTNLSKQKPWASLIAMMAMENKVELVTDAPVFISMYFQFTRPKKHFRGKAQTLREDAPDFHITKPDSDKLARCVLDALTSIAYKDDSQVQIGAVYKTYADQPGVQITISN